MSEALRAIKEAIHRRPGEIEKAKALGRKVAGTYCCYTPLEIIHALGIIPVRLGWGGDDRLAEDGIPYITNIQCPFVRQNIGVFKEGKNPYAVNTDVIVVSAVCLQEYRMTEVIKYYFNKETITISVPKNFYLPEGKEFYTKELEAFIVKLEQMTGNKLDEKELAKSIELYADIRKKVADLYALLARENSSIKWRDVHSVVQAGFYLDPEKYLLLIEALYKEQELIESQRNESKKNEVRVLISGSILAPGDTKLIDVLEQYGATIVADDTCYGQRTFADLIIEEPTLRGITEGYLNKVPCAAQLYPYRNTDKRLLNLFQLIEQYKADAIIYHTIRFCDPYTFRYEENKKIFDERGIPFLQLHTDYGAADIGQLTTRVGALVEMIRRKKNLKEAYYVRSQA